MCGRFNLADLTWAEVWNLMHGRAPEKWNEAGQIPEIPQRFNVAPTTDVPMVGFCATVAVPRWRAHWLAGG